MQRSPAMLVKRACVSGTGLSLLGKMIITSLVRSFNLAGYADLVLSHQCPPPESLLKEFLCLRSSLPSIFRQKLIPFGWIITRMTSLSVLTGFDSIKSFWNFIILSPIKANNLSDTRTFSEPWSALMTKSDLKSLFVSIWSNSHNFIVTGITSSSEGDSILTTSTGSHTFDVYFLDCVENVCRWFEYHQWYHHQWWRKCILYYTILAKFLASNVLHSHSLQK